MNEPIKTLNGVVLSAGQSMTLRVALSHFRTQLNDPTFVAELGEPHATLYRDRLDELQAIAHGQQPLPPQPSLYMSVVNAIARVDEAAARIETAAAAFIDGSRRAPRTTEGRCPSCERPVRIPTGDRMVCGCGCTLRAP